MTVGSAKPHPEWRLIVEALALRDYGTIVTHEDIMQFTALRYPSPRYFAQVSRARRELLRDWERELASEPKVGYRLVLPGEFHGRGRRELIFAGRRLNLSALIHNAAPQALLSVEDNARNANALAKLGALKVQYRKAVQDTRPTAAIKTRDMPKMVKV
jgi:hypothetical protein